MTGLTAEETLTKLEMQDIETIVPEQPVMLACGIMGNPLGNDIIEAKAQEPGFVTDPKFIFEGPECT